MRRRLEFSRSRSGSASLNPLCGRLAEACNINLTDDGTQRAFGLHDTLPHDLGARQGVSTSIAAHVATCLPRAYLIRHASAHSDFQP